MSLILLYLLVVLKLLLLLLYLIISINLNFGLDPTPKEIHCDEELEEERSGCSGAEDSLQKAIGGIM